MIIILKNSVGIKQGKINIKTLEGNIMLLINKEKLKDLKGDEKFGYLAEHFAKYIKDDKESNT